MRNLNFDFSGVSQIDWARLAAYLDGEGHIRIVSKTQTVKGKCGYQQEYIELGVSNTNPVLLQWLVGKFGGSIQSNRKATKKTRQSWNWNVAAAHASRILERALPYFLLKREQAELALAFYSTMRRYGVKGTPQNVREKRAELRTKLRALTARGPREVVAAG